MHLWHQASGILQLASKNPSCWLQKYALKVRHIHTVSSKIYSLFLISLNWWLHKSFLLFSGVLKLESLFTCCSSINKKKCYQHAALRILPLFLHSSFSHWILNLCTEQKSWGLCRLNVVQGQAVKKKQSQSYTRTSIQFIFLWKDIPHERLQFMKYT